jgi:hypothetical protein
MAVDDQTPFEGSARAARAADRAARAAERRHRRMERWRRHPHKTPPVFFGIVFVLIGTLFLLDNLNVIDARYVFRTFWPLLILGWGVTRLLTTSYDRLIPLLAIVLGGLLLGNQLGGWDMNVGRLFWPVVLIVVGGNILYRAWFAQAAPPPIPTAAAGAFVGGESAAVAPGGPASSGSTFKEFAFMAGVERRNVSQTFRGGDATAIMGHVELDLRECRMAAGEAFVDVFVLMGEVTLRIPRDWTVDSRVSVMMANLEDSTDVPIGPSTQRLVLRGSSFMGNVEIRN